MAERKIVDNVYNVGAIDWDREFFDELIPLPDGTSYNSYIVKGSEKIALIDTVDPVKYWELERNLEELSISKIDYVIANHAEQDHSGSIPYILEKYPMAKVVTNEKCKELLKTHLHLKDDVFIIVNDNDSISLGDKTLEFILTPWVHWPETMTTYLKEDKILFSCDFFGSHKATSSIFVEDEHKVVEDAKRYFAEIMMPFRNIVKSDISKIEKKEISFIAPSHGPVYNNPSIIINAYKEWVSDKVYNKVVIPYISMHGSTEIIVNYITNKLINNDIKVVPINLSNADLGFIAMELVDAATVIIGTPFVLAGAHPKAVYAAFLVNALRPKTKFLSIVGSMGWGGKCIDQLKSILGNMKSEIIDPVFSYGLPTNEDYKNFDKLVETIISKHKQINIL